VKVVARHYGRQVRDEVVGGIVRESLADALDQEQLRPAAVPHIAPLETASGVTYTATFDVLPDISLPQFESIEIARPVATVSDEDVDRMLERMRVQRRTWREVERAATPSDRVVVNLEGHVDGEPLEEARATELPVELDAGRMVDGFEDGLVGAQAGEDRTLELSFPEAYPEHLAGRPVTFDVKVHRVEEPVLPDVDDEFAESFGVADGSVEALRREARANMERELGDGLRALLKQRVMEALLAGDDIELPESMVRDEVARAMQRRYEELERSGIGHENIELSPDAFEAPVRRRIALELVVAEIVREHRIELDHARVRARVEIIASTYQQPATVLDWYYSDRSRLAPIESFVFEEQVVEWVLEHAQVTDEPTSFDRILNHGQTDAVAA
jgi:trigger factor